MAELAKYTDACLTKKDAIKKKESSGEKMFRSWYCTMQQWVSDFNTLHASHGSSTQLSEAKTSYEEPTVTEMFIVPADEHFTRCPISKEVFETFWDNDEGEFMYRNAVKVLVTEKADPNMFRLSMPTSEEQIRYCLLHKILVVDEWVEQGRIDSLKNIKFRYAVAQKSLLEKIVAAAGDEEEDDIFVVIEK